jgi:hypothetical protein
MRSISCVADVSINTVYKLLAEAGPVCAQSLTLGAEIGDLQRGNKTASHLRMGA